MLFSSRCSGSLDVLSTVPCSFVTTAELSPSLTQPRSERAWFSTPSSVCRASFSAWTASLDDDREEHDARDDGGHAPRTLAPLLLRLGGSRTP